MAGARRPTPDGTTVADYAHVQDLADAHVAAVARLSAGWHGTAAYDVGTGRGTSVFGVLDALGQLAGGTVPWVEGPSCPREPAWAVADPEPAARDLRWRSTRTLEQALWFEWLQGRHRLGPGTRAHGPPGRARRARPYDSGECHHRGDVQRPEQGLDLVECLVHPKPRPRPTGPAANASSVDFAGAAHRRAGPLGG